MSPPTSEKPLRVCIIGATGRMGTLIAREAQNAKFEITGAVAAPDDPNLGRTLRDIGARDSETKIAQPSNLGTLLRNSDVCISFCSAQAEMSNLPVISAGGVPYVSGTTGLSPQQRTEV